MSAAYRTILAKLALNPGQSLLDVGCGAGMFASMASARGLLVSGIDASDALLAIARERAPSADFRVGDLEDLPFPGESFDAVTGFNAYQFATNPVAALSAAGRAVVEVSGRPDQRGHRDPRPRSRPPTIREGRRDGPPQRGIPVHHRPGAVGFKQKTPSQAQERQDPQRESVAAALSVPSS